MNDITMCQLNFKTECPDREMCYRYKATPSQYQSYACLLEIDKKTRACKNFLLVELELLTKYKMRFVKQGGENAND